MERNALVFKCGLETFSIIFKMDDDESKFTGKPIVDAAVCETDLLLSLTSEPTQAGIECPTNKRGSKWVASGW